MIAITATSVKLSNFFILYIYMIHRVFILYKRRDLNGTPRTSRTGADP